MDNIWIISEIPSGYVKIAIAAMEMAIEIVSFPMKHGDLFYSYVKLPEGINNVLLVKK